MHGWRLFAALGVVVAAAGLSGSAAAPAGVARVAAATPAPIDLGTLGGSSSLARAVNDGGEVVGTAQIRGNEETHAFSWTTEGGMLDLGTLGSPGGLASSYAVAVNTGGQVVGYSETQRLSAPNAGSGSKEGGRTDHATFAGPSR